MEQGVPWTFHRAGCLARSGLDGGGVVVCVEGVGEGEGIGI